jgi:hypothetical protein
MSVFATAETEVLSFLKAAEHDAALLIEGAAKIEPQIAEVAGIAATAAGYPEVNVAIQKIGNVIVGAGALISAATNGTGSGADKLATAAPGVEALIKNSGFLGTAAVANVSKWDSAIQAITSGFADLFDSIVKKAPAVPAIPVAAPAAVAPAVPVAEQTTEEKAQAAIAGA